MRRDADSGPLQALVSLCVWAVSLSFLETNDHINGLLGSIQVQLDIPEANWIDYL